MRLAVLLRRITVLSCQVQADTEVTGITCDSRQVQKGGLFVAIAGTQTDGLQYVSQALDNGAGVIVAQRPLPGVPCVQVPDTRLALAQLSACFYGDPAKALTMVAVTGTNGKSSVAWLLQQVLEKVTGERAGLLGTLENHLGDRVLPAGRTTPQSDQLHRLLAQMREGGCRYAVMEVSSHALDQQRVAGIDFRAAAFTNLSRDHLDYHGTMQRYCRAKAALFRQCERAVVNGDDPWHTGILTDFQGQVLTTSASREADLYARDIRLLEDRVCFMAVYRQRCTPVTVPIPGRFSVHNALSVLGLALCLDIPPETAAPALRTARPIPGRIEPVALPGREYTAIIDYAHTPDGMENVLTTLRGFCRGRLITVFGCGGERDPGKRPEMGNIATRLSDVTIITSDNPRFEPPMDIIRDILQGVRTDADHKVLENRVQAIRYAMDIAKKDDIIVLLGKGHETCQEIRGQRLAFDEREILQRISAEKR